MERLQVAVLAACVMSMVTGMLQLLRPNEKFDRQLRLLTAGMMLFSILIPLMQGISEIQPAWNFLEPQSVEEESSITEQVQEQLTTQIEQNLEQNLQVSLETHGIVVTDLTVCAHISEEQRIDISSVHVVCDAPGAAKQLLQADLGEEVHLIVEAATSTPCTAFSLFSRACSCFLVFLQAERNRHAANQSFLRGFCFGCRCLLYRVGRAVGTDSFHHSGRWNLRCDDYASQYIYLSVCER